ANTPHPCATGVPVSSRTTASPWAIRFPFRTTLASAKPCPPVSGARYFVSKWTVTTENAGRMVVSGACAIAESIRMPCRPGCSIPVGQTARRRAFSAKAFRTPPSRIDEGGLPSAAVRSTADHGVALRPNLIEEGSPMEAYVGLDVHSKRSVFVIEAEDGRVVARGDIPTTPEGFRRLRRQHELTAETPVALETGTVAF